MAINFKCAVCIEEKSEDRPHYAGEHAVCIECTRLSLVPQFERALNFEHFYPVKFGEVVLDISDFSDVLTDGFIQRFRKREIEYKTKVSDRLYCPHEIVSRGGDEEVLNVLDVVLTPEIRREKCNAFVGSKKTSEYLFCFECTGLACARCEEPLIDSFITDGHTCKPPTQQDGAANFDGLEKGVAWQNCPHCEIKVELKELCNEITCACGGNFCFVCGISLANGGGDHFVATCPRYGPAATAGVADFDYVLPSPRVPNLPQLTEATTVSTLSVRIGRNPRPGENILNAVMDRDLLLRTADELQQEWLDEEGEDHDWRFSTASLIYRFADIVQLIIVAARSEWDELLQLSKEFEGIMERIGDPFPRPPRQFLLEHREVQRLLDGIWERQDEIHEYLIGYDVEDIEINVDVDEDEDADSASTVTIDSDDEIETESAEGEDG